MRSTTHTGGNIEFGDTEALEDTDSTKKFKEKYEEYYSKPKWKRILTRIKWWFNKK
jgi:hypothetical protein